MSSDEQKRLPEGWRWAKLEDVCEVKGGKRLPSGTDFAKQTTRYPYIRVVDFQDGTVDERHLKYLDEATQRQISRYVINKGDVFISIAGTIGVVGVIQDHLDGANLTENAARLVIKDKSFLSRDYLSVVLRSPLGQESIRLRTNTVGQPKLALERIKSIFIPLPPLPEQQRIAAILTEKMAAVEKARSAAEARLRAAKELPAAYMREVFESEEAQGWPRKRLGDVLSLRNEIVHPYDKPEGKATFVGLEHLQSGTGVRFGSVEVYQEALTGRKPKFYSGDIVYGYLRPYLNKVWIAEFDGLCSVDQYVYSVDETQADTRYVAWYMRSPLYLNRAPIDTTPGQLPRIRKEEVATVHIELPPLPDQIRIADQIDAKMNASRYVSECVDAEQDAILKLPAALLRQAFAGEL